MCIVQPCPARLEGHLWSAVLRVGFLAEAVWTGSQSNLPHKTVHFKSEISGSIAIKGSSVSFDEGLFDQLAFLSGMVQKWRTSTVPTGLLNPAPADVSASFGFYSCAGR